MSWFRSDRRRVIVPILGFSAVAVVVWAVVAATVGYELSCGWGIGCYPTGDTILWIGAIFVSLGGLLHAAVASKSLARGDADGRAYGGAWAVLALVVVALGVLVHPRLPALALGRFHRRARRPESRGHDRRAALDRPARAGCRGAARCAAGHDFELLTRRG